MSRLRIMRLGYLLSGSTVLALLLGAGLFGWEMGGAGKRGHVPASVRSSPGGLHGFSYWHSGYRGGK